MNFVKFAMVTSLLVVTSMKMSCAKPLKKVVIHVPMKVKHHHHTHTVVKHVHHQVPIHYDHQDVHVIHPETAHEDYDDGGDYHFSHGRTLEDYGRYSDSHSDRESDFDEYEKFLRKRSKSKKKLFNNMVIGWRGRSDFDKIASEYLASIKRQRTPNHDDYDYHYSAYGDDEHSR